MFGIAIASSSPAVAARCAYARAKVGAVASQNVTDPRLGEYVLDLLAGGADAKTAIAQTKDAHEFMEYRQILAIDASGKTASYSGEKSLGIWAEATSDKVAAGGNLLGSQGVPQAIVDAFIEASGHLGDRLLTAMQAGLDAGGEAGDIHSAGLKLVDEVPWAIADLRCDWSEQNPIATLGDIWQLYKPQLDDYINRAINPSLAPSYGVPGDE